MDNAEAKPIKKPPYIEHNEVLPETRAKKFIDLKKEQARDAEEVSGIFHYYELPGGTLDFVFKKYKGDPVRKFKLVDGERCKIPLGVAKHLNSSGTYPVHEFNIDKEGRPTQRIGKKVRRYGFQSLEFIADEDFLVDPDTNIVVVQPLGR